MLTKEDMILNMIQMNNKNLESLKKDMDQRFDVVDQRFDVVDQRLEKMDQRFDRLESKVNQMDNRLVKIQTVIDIDKTRREDRKNRIYTALFTFFSIAFTGIVVYVLDNINSLFR